MKDKEFLFVKEKDATEEATKEKNQKLLQKKRTRRCRRSPEYHRDYKTKLKLKNYVFSNSSLRGNVIRSGLINSIHICYLCYSSL